jgi:thiol-disulfide isomerase/thioredoxin
VVFIGTWCDDSHYLLPKLTKVLQLAGYPLTGVTMYGTDRDKKTKNGEQAQYGITLVPTIILLKNGKEAGRITESALKSVEEDLAKMVSEK